MIFEKCQKCGSYLVEWRTKEGIKGISGLECPKCPDSQTIDQYPHDLITRQVRRQIASKMDVSKFKEMDWLRAEEAEGYVI